MAINLELDLHEFAGQILYQYKESSRFIGFIQSFITPAFLDVEASFFALLNGRSLDAATGGNLRRWAEMFDVPFTGQSDEGLRNDIYWAVTEKFGTGSIYEVQAFFKKWYRAANVIVEEVGNGEINLRVIDGVPVPGDDTITDWPCFPAGMAQINDIDFSPGGILFSFLGDNDPNAAGYGIVLRSAFRDVDAPRYRFPDPLIYSGQAIWYTYFDTGEFQNVTLNFRVQNDRASATINAFNENFAFNPADEKDGGLIGFYDRNGTEWAFFRNHAVAAPDLITSVVSGPMTTISIKCVKDNLQYLKLRVFGVSHPWVCINGLADNFSSLSPYDISQPDEVIWDTKNPDNLIIKYDILERSGVGGRFTVKLG